MTTDLGRSAPSELRLTDVDAIPAEPQADQMYRHRARFFESARLAWKSREIIFTLAERDVRAQYKQATLGVLWALLTPVLTLIVFVVVFTRAKAGFGYEGLPPALFMFPGIMCWTYFSSCVTTGGTSLLTNKALLSKTQFPRECFPIDSMLVAGLNTLLSVVPLAILFAINGMTPKIQTLWFPVFVVIEVIFAAGVTFAVAGIIIQMRDLVQVLPILVSLGQFLCPVVWPFSKVPKNLQPVYSFFNPLGPVIDNVRRTMLKGQAPTWGLLGIATVGSLLYLVIGYRVFKRMEVQFADLA